jgi:hypothetical protein
MKWVRNHWIAIVTAAVLFFVGIGIGASGSSTESATETTVTETQIENRTVTNTETVEEKPAEPADPAGSIEGDGTFLVGDDIAPGTYRAAAPTSGNCYWARLRDLDGGIKSIIANGNTSGPVVIRVAARDYAVETTGCETFQRIS